VGEKKQNPLIGSLFVGEKLFNPLIEILVVGLKNLSWEKPYCALDR
jgi:hypothetical protein